jgi:putative SOS response-associated peptidase YedK
MPLDDLLSRIVEPVHNRMAVILPEAMVEARLDPKQEDLARLKSYLAPVRTTT